MGWFQFHESEDEPLTLERVVFQALGAASGCWENLAKAGVFESEKALEIGKSLLEWVQNNTIDAAHIERQKQFTTRTFGPGPRTKDVLDHIRSELKEVEESPLDLSEWADIIILAMDGAWRAGHEPQDIIDAIKAKQLINEGRVWPKRKGTSEDEPIEHVRDVNKQWHYQAPSSKVWVPIIPHPSSPLVNMTLEEGKIYVDEIGNSYKWERSDG